MTDLQNEGRKIGRSRANLITANIIEQECQQSFAELLMPPSSALAEQPLPLKERPDFIAGYRAGLADGKFAAIDALAEQPVAPTDEEIYKWKSFVFLPSLSKSNQLAYPITDKDMRIIARAVLARWGQQ